MLDISKVEEELFVCISDIHFSFRKRDPVIYDEGFLKLFTIMEWLKENANEPPYITKNIFGYLYFIYYKMIVHEEKVPYRDQLVKKKFAFQRLMQEIFLDGFSQK